MKLPLAPCLKCKEDSHSPEYWVANSELQDNLVFPLECPEGHKSFYVLNIQKFEILFDMGTSALLDGYSREAVSTYAAAQERFHEFAIKVFLAKHKIQGSHIAETWKLVSNQSERQLGAFYFLYLLHFNKVPPTNQNNITFRNRVIHKGFIPSYQHVWDYANYIYTYIIDTVKSMKSDLKLEIEQVCKNDLDEMIGTIPAGSPMDTINFPSLIHLAAPDSKFGNRSFKQIVKYHKDQHILELENRLEEFENDDDE